MRSDHNSLNCIRSISETTGMPAHWILRVFKFDLDIVHGGVIKNRAADLCSRPKTRNKDSNDIKDDIFVAFVNSIECKSKATGI